MGVDLTKNFYFSYTYSLASTLQENCVPSHCSIRGEAAAMTARAGGVDGSSSSSFSPVTPAPHVDWDSMFVWNSFLTRALREALGSGGPSEGSIGGDQWVLPLVHGYFEQRVCTAAQKVAGPG